MALLTKARCKVDKATSSGRTPVFRAALPPGRTEAVPRLIEARYDVDKADDDGCALVLSASAEQKTEVAALLTEAKCDVDKATNTNGSTTIRVCCHCQREEGAQVTGLPRATSARHVPGAALLGTRLLGVDSRGRAAAA